MLEKMKEIIAEQLGVEEDEITPDTSFKEDLGADSLDLFELTMALEEEYDTEIPAEELEDIETVGDVIEYLREKGLLYQRPDYIVSTYFALIKSMQDMMIKKEEFRTRDNYLELIDYYHALYFHRPGGQIHSALLAVQREYELKFPIKKEEN